MMESEIIRDLRTIVSAWELNGTGQWVAGENGVEKITAYEEPGMEHGRAWIKIIKNGLTHVRLPAGAVGIEYSTRTRPPFEPSKGPARRHR